MTIEEEEKLYGNNYHLRYEELLKKYYEDTHILQDQLDLANARIIELQKENEELKRKNEKLIDRTIQYDKTLENLQKKNEELKKLIAFKTEYTNKLEEDLFQNCSNYVVPKDKIREKIRKINIEGKIKLKKLGGTDRYLTKLEYMHKENVLQELLTEE